ncbi:UNVERIFIED_CONTAM: hypothetical protein FKN15_047622 [Acipenser sinensis]
MYAMECSYKYEMKGKKEWRMVCEKIPGTQCDFSEKVNYFGMFHLRLRAKSGRETSPWVIIEFCAEKDANLGPPSKVNVISKKGMLEVSIADPMASENKSMRELQKIYFISYKYEMKGKKEWRMVCEKIPGTQCDFSEKVNYFGMFHLRLRAKSGRETSPWVIIEFCAEKDANLGPPSKVNVISKKGMLEVSIADPMASENKSMRELQKIYFMVVYWKNTSGAKNIRVKAVNTQYILEWDWDPQQYDESVRFTAEYIYEYERYSKEYSFNRVCYKIPQTQCDFTYQDIHYFEGQYLRLRAESKNVTSKWKELKFCPEEHSALGPPSKVDVESRNGLLKVNITDPLTHKNESMQTLIKISFLIVYWKNTSTAENLTLTVNNTETLLTGLEPWTLYCLRVQAFNIQFRKRSQFTEPVCRLTTCKDDGLTPVWMALFVFISSVGLLLFCSYGVYVIYKVIKYSCFPQLPDSMQLYEITPNFQYTELLLKEVERELCSDLGPPIVKLEVENGVLYVSISDPLENSTNKSLKYYYAQLKYQVTYWKEHEKMIELDPSPNTSIRLEELEPGAMYCVEVKTVKDYYHDNNQVGKPSKVDCKYIYDNDPTKVVVFVVLSAVVISLFVIGCFFLVRYTPGFIKDLLHPAWNVPDHIAEADVNLISMEISFS